MFGDDLRQHRLVALALHGNVGGHGDGAERIDIHRRHRHRAALRTGFVAGGRGQRGRQVAHVRHRRLDHRGKADAVDAPRFARVRAPALEIGEPAAADGQFERAQIVAGIVQRAGRGAVREFSRRDQIAPDHVERIELELDRDARDEPLQGEIKLRAAEAANEARRHFVGEHDAVCHLDVCDVVGAGHRAVHAVERSRHRRAQKRAVIFELIELEREDAAVVGDRRLDFGNPVRPGTGGNQMLDAILDPFDRAAGDFRRQRDQHDIGKHRKLDAETAAGIRRNAQPQFRPRHAQRARHHRVHGERALEIRQHVVAGFGRIVLRDHDVAFDRRERQPVIRHRHGDAAVGAGEGRLGIAVAKFAHRDFVGLGFRVQQRRRGLAGAPRIDHRRQRPIVDRHQLGGVLGDIAALRHHQRDRLADIAHALDRQRPLLHRHLDDGEKRVRQFADVLPGDDGPHAVMRQRRARIDAGDLGMGVRGADDMGVQGADRNRQIVGIAAAAAKQRGVLLAEDGFGAAGIFCAHCFSFNSVIASEATLLRSLKRASEGLSPPKRGARRRKQSSSLGRLLDCFVALLLAMTT